MGVDAEEELSPTGSNRGTSPKESLQENKNSDQLRDKQRGTDRFIEISNDSQANEPKTAAFFILVVVGADEDVEHEFHDKGRDVRYFGILFEKLGFLLQQYALYCEK